MTDLSDFRTALQKLSQSGEAAFREDALLSELTTFRIGGRADFLIEPNSQSALAAVILAARQAGVRYRLLGNGSNLLFADAGYRGAVIRTARLTGCTVSETAVHADCGVSLTALACAAAKSGLSGLEFAYGIPGSVGGAIYMNAGAYGGEIKDVLTKSRCLGENGEIVTLTADDHKFGYRTSCYQSGDKVVLSADFELKPDDQDAIRARMQDYMARRKEKQPLEYPSAGSTFKRSPGFYTGKLIEDAGLKGYSVGGAAVSEKHAGFVINKGNATASDVIELIRRIQAIIYEKNGVELECEVRIIPERE